MFEDTERRDIHDMSVAMVVVHWHDAVKVNVTIGDEEAVKAG